MTVALARKTRVLVLTAALLAVFLGALDALIIGAAMPTIISDLGGLELYSWVFSAYMLTRAIALPLFGKLADLYSSKKLFVFAVGAFLIGSPLAGMVDSMPQLVCLRALQGIGAGGNFALAYIVVSEVSSPEERGRMMGLISFVWGVSSVLGPILGGFIVTYLTWPWVFYINLPVGGLAVFFILRFFQESRQKKSGAPIDYLGALVSHYIHKSINSLLNSPLRSEISPNTASHLSQSLQEFLRPEVVKSLSSTAVAAIRASIGKGVEAVFWTALIASFLSIILCKMMPERKTVQ